LTQIRTARLELRRFSLFSNKVKIQNIIENTDVSGVVRAKRGRSLSVLRRSFERKLLFYHSSSFFAALKTKPEWRWRESNPRPKL